MKNLISSICILICFLTLPMVSAGTVTTNNTVIGAKQSAILQINNASQKTIYASLSGSGSNPSISVGTSVILNSHLGDIWTIYNNSGSEIGKVQITNSEQSYTYQNTLVSSIPATPSMTMSWRMNANPSWSHANQGGLSMRQVCSLKNGVYPDNLSIVMNGMNTMDVTGFKKIGKRVFFNGTYGISSGKWMLNCMNGTVSQR